MGHVFFYHLTRNPVEQTLATLLERSLAQGWRVAVRAPVRARLEALDRALWTGPDDSFLPHGLAGGAHDADQPILLTEGEAGNAPHCVMSVDGAEVAAEDVAGLERVCILFDGHDPAAVDHARGQWKTLTAAGCKAVYWSEESGRWEKKAESG
ncbi:DNA polymerase III subunit chi [Cognatishimia sp. F0-27]|uniref:DNA polymerase III subunit chi n=1 Tax=Cognatishimia sp. F0-27 TaxID=2816855 RepID=UPI001D0C2054|nr:DNA polymerase III subunit chi [Cognatishimia sp. F0-27]MCC1493369.1 DNA polymerase III subunit chi [Cognatishimia sp. F0-27]